MHAPQPVDEVQRVQPCVVSDSAGDDLKGLGIHVHDQLLLARHLHCVLLQPLGKFHLSGTASSHDLVSLEAPPHDHNGIVEGTLSFLDELFSSSPQDNGG